MRSRWATVLTFSVLLGGVSILHSWSLRTYSSWARAQRPITLEERLKQFRDETDPEKRVAWVQSFGHIRDPRVTVALMEAVQEEVAKDWTGHAETPGLLLIASFAVVTHHIPEADRTFGKCWTVALGWWEMNENVVRCQALTRMGEANRVGHD